MTAELTCDQSQQRASVHGRQQRRFAPTNVLITRRIPLVGPRQVDPQLNTVEQAAAHHQFLRRGLDVEYPRACGHPLGVTVGDPTPTTVRVLMNESAVDDVGDRLEAPVRMPRGPFRFPRGVVDLSHLVHMDERVQIGKAHAGEGATDGESLSFQSCGCGRDRPHGPLASSDRIRRGDPRQRQYVLNCHCWHRRLFRVGYGLVFRSNNICARNIPARPEGPPDSRR